MATKAKPQKKAGTNTGTSKKRIRKIFGDIHEVVQMPNLIEVQRESYEQFLRSDPAIDYVSGLEKTLRSVFPIRDFAGTAELDFVHYELEPPKHDTVECKQRGITYAAPMKVTLRLIVFEVDQETETRSVLDIKEQDVYMGDMPLMTENGTFIINGTERVIVSQMHRSPGVLFDHDRGKTHSSGKLLFAARIIPYRGSWLDFEFDAKDIVNVRIDRKRKLPVTALLYALGLDAEDILDHFYNTVAWERVSGKAGDGWKIPFVADQWRGQKPAFALVDAKTGEEVFPAGQKISPRAANKAAKDGLETLLLPTDEIFGRYAAKDMIDEKTGRIYIEAGDEVSPDNLEVLDGAGVDKLELLDIDHITTGPWIRNTLKVDKAENRDEGLEAIYKVMRPGEPPTKETAEALFEGLFFDGERYDLSAVGRVKLNMRLDLDAPRAGLVEALPYRRGERPPAGAPLVVMLADGPPYARVFVPATQRVSVAVGTPAIVQVYGSDRQWAGRVRFVASEAAFTPYYALNERDRSRLSYLAEVELTEADAAGLPVGVPVEVVLESGAPP